MPKKLIGVLILIFMVAFPLATSAAQGGVTVTTLYNVNLRSGPGTSYQVLVVVPYDTTLPAQARNADSSWVLVQHGSQRGWMAAWTTSVNGDLNSLPVSNEVIQTGDVQVTTYSIVNIRSGPGIGYSKLGKLPAGVTVSPVARNAANNWLLIDYNGVHGWIAQWVVKIEGNTSSLPISNENGVADDPPSGPKGDDPTPAPPPPPKNPGANRFQNPGFEGNFRPVVFREINVFEAWEPFYCADPYIWEHCPDEGKCEIDCAHPSSGKGRPEYKPTGIDKYVNSGASAQQWFCSFWPCRGGVFQTVATKPGEVCEVGAYVQSWSNNDGNIASDIDSDSDKVNARWQILVDPYGGSNAFALGLDKSRKFGFADGIYDQFVLIQHTFVAKSNYATVFFYDYRMWGFINNDSFIDDAYVICD